MKTDHAFYRWLVVLDFYWWIITFSSTNNSFALNSSVPFSGIDFVDDAIALSGISECGLIETNAQDSDWVIATSDRIFRQSLCKASLPCAETSWYDTPFAPCYAENRFWKLRNDSGIAYAFPLGAIGVGSFDSLYVRRNIKLQFFTGLDDRFPYGNPLNGPRYVSITFWRDVNVACDGFEPNTFFVEGGPGALSDYSLVLGDTDLKISSIDLREKENKKAHRTDEYKDHYALRRNNGFTVKVSVSKGYGKSCYDVYFEATHTFNGGAAVKEVPQFTSTVPIDTWGAEIVGVTKKADGSSIVEMKINIPPKAAIGNYKFKVKIKRAGGSSAINEKDFGQDILILFNPWGSQDDSFLADDNLRKEYVLNQNGYIWRSTAKAPWRYSQFTKDTVEAMLMLIEGKNENERSNVKLISRHLSKMVNYEDENGVLVGRWESTFPGGKEPGFWSGSDQVISQYKTSGPVKYGQCWVFAGVLATFMRAAGIASRPVTCLVVGWDRSKPIDKIIDVYWKSDGKIDTITTKDKSWNFHVWNEGYFLGEWNALDATPQETSDGFYQLGPAALSRVKAKSGGQYDVDFVEAEVDALYREWVQGPTGYRKSYESDTLIGQSMVTKAVGSSAGEDVMAQYKTPGTRMRTRSLLTGITVALDIPDQIVAGSDLNVKVTVTSTSIVPLNVTILIASSAISYDGSELSFLNSTSVPLIVNDGATAVVELRIPSSEILTWMPVTNLIRSFHAVFVNDEASSGTDTTTVTFPATSIKIAPNTPRPPGGKATVTLAFENTMKFDVTDVFLTLSFGNGLSLQGDDSLVRSVGKIAAGRKFSISIVFIAEEVGEQYFTLALAGSQMGSNAATGIIQVFADCNKNGISDDVDLSSGKSKDCDGNDVPDECQKADDCNKNRIPDSCEITKKPSLDCNGNFVLDTCDLASKTSQDKNKNKIPDECEKDCNNNGKPDDLDIANGTSFDFNKNGVPDECDDDCNSNGVNDEIDITLQNSTDANQNGVPDECEVKVPPPTCSRLQRLLRLCGTPRCGILAQWLDLC